MKDFIENYNKLGLRLFAISNQRNQFNYRDSNILKSPSTNPTKSISPDDFQDDFTGIGINLGPSLFAIDLDGVIEHEPHPLFKEGIIEKLLGALGLPKDYPWVVKTGSNCGYHILFKTKLPKRRNLKSTKSLLSKWNQLSGELEFGEYDVNAYYSTRGGVLNEPYFNKIEFLWSGQLVLPPSIHKSGGKYSFVHNFPTEEPAEIDFEKLKSSTFNFRNHHAISSRHQSGDFDLITYPGIDSTQLNWDVWDNVSRKYPIPDSIEYNYQSKRNELAVVLLLGQFKVPFTPYPVKHLVMNQLCWFVIDKDFNVKKRRMFNYLNSQKDPQFVFSEIRNEMLITKICDNKRVVYSELLFDIDHVQRIVCWNKAQLDFIKKEILSSGLYLDNFHSKLKADLDEFPFPSYKAYWSLDCDNINELEEDLSDWEEKLEKKHLIGKGEKIIKPTTFLEVMSEKKLDKYNHLTLHEQKEFKTRIFKHLYRIKATDYSNVMEGLTVLYAIFQLTVHKSKFSKME